MSSSNEISTQNQLIIDEVSHKITYKLKPLNYHNVEQTSLLYSNILIKRGILTLEKKWCNTHCVNWCMRAAYVDRTLQC